MTEKKDTSEKILFRFFSDILNEWTVETMWADAVDKNIGLYKLDSIPFYAAISSDDIVFAEYDDSEQMLTYRKTVEYSGNSIVQVVLMNNETDINNIRDIFSKMGCASEKLNEEYFVMEIPFDKDYTYIRQKLNELEEEKIIGYAEPCLSDKHQY
ncbi:MAG: DUF4265 domain-containing protein [Ferruginibacter sp.]